MFLINDIEIISQSKDFIMYKLHCVAESEINLIKNINYATNKDNGPMSPYKIISDICNKSHILFDTRYVDTAAKIDFISSPKMCVKEMIDYCLQLGITEKNPPSYFFSNLLTGKYIIYNNESINIIPELMYDQNLVVTVNTEVNESEEPVLAVWATDIISVNPVARN